jgi:hypothetical protein
MNESSKNGDYLFKQNSKGVKACRTAKMTILENDLTLASELHNYLIDIPERIQLEHHN